MHPSSCADLHGRVNCQPLLSDMLTSDRRRSVAPARQAAPWGPLLSTGGHRGLASGRPRLRPRMSSGGLAWALLVLALAATVLAADATLRAEERAALAPGNVQAAPELLDVDAGNVTPPCGAGIEPQPGPGGRRVFRPAAGVDDGFIEHGQRQMTIRGQVVVGLRAEAAQFGGCRRTVLRSTSKARLAVSW